MNESLEKIKDKYAYEAGFADWEVLVSYGEDMNKHIDEVAYRYNKSQTQELVEMVKYLYNFSKGRHFHSGSVTDRTVTELLIKYQKS